MDYDSYDLVKPIDGDGDVFVQIIDGTTTFDDIKEWIAIRHMRLVKFMRMEELMVFRIRYCCRRESRVDRHCGLASSSQYSSNLCTI